MRRPKVQKLNLYLFYNVTLLTHNEIKLQSLFT